MEKIILEILKKIEINKEYIKLCQEYYNIDGQVNLKRKEVEPIIHSYDRDFKYIAKDKTFVKETTFKEYTVRFFIGFKSGIVGLGYLIWKEGENHNYYKGNLLSLSKQIDAEFEHKVKYNSPIATSVEDFEKILSKIFELFEEFLKLFRAKFGNQFNR